MAKKKKQARKSSPVKKPVSLGTPVLGQVIIHYVQVAVPVAHAQDVAEAMGHLILSDVQRSYLRDRQDEI